MSAVEEGYLCECGDRLCIPEPVFKTGETDFRRCANCSLVFRQVFPSLSELSAIYRDAYETEKIASAGTDQESGPFASKSYGRFIRLHTQSCARVLDYGAGSGDLVTQLRAAGIVADGLEFSEDAREYCQSQRGITLLSDLHETRDGEYELVSMIEVIEHLTELQGTLAEVYRVLAPGGKLLITTPNLRGFRARKEGGLWHEARKKFHLFLFTEKSLRFHLEKAGFKRFLRIRFSPLQRPGIKFLLSARLSQLFGMGGTICVLVRKEDF